MYRILEGKIIKTFKIYFEGNEVVSINNYDEVMTNMDFWLVDSKGATGDTGKTAVVKTFTNRFRIPVDFELLNDIGP